MTMRYPDVVTAEVWETAHTDLLAREKQLTRARDALNAHRRRQPMTPVPAGYRFADPAGEYDLADLFDGRSTLIVYHHMLAPDSGHICRGCSMFGDNIANLAHLRARDITFAMVAQARVAEIEAVKARLGWSFPWYSCFGSTFHDDLVTRRGNMSGLSVFLRRGEEIFRTYFTGGRGVDQLGAAFTFADLTPYGRRESWEDSPDGWPQDPTHSWERLNDEYGSRP
jgi:predicted dithiol-disulfide oxidoreductase (DUF899 family)